MEILFTKKKKDDIAITVSVDGESVSDLNNEKLSELFKELSEKIKKERS